MLYRYTNQFIEYCRLADFSVRSTQALDIRLNEFKAFLKSQRIRPVKKITYLHLVDFVADYKDPSIHVRKSRVWTLRQFYHFLVLHRHVAFHYLCYRIWKECFLLNCLWNCNPTLTCHSALW